MNFSGHGRRSAMRLMAFMGAGLALAIAIAWLLRGWSQPLRFDDAYMFFRYAINLRAGLGVSWNPDGVPVYGMTGQLWVYCLLPLTWLPFAAGPLLQLASWLAGLAAILVMALAVSRHADSGLLRIPALAVSAVALPLLINPYFAGHLTTGMDTTLSLLANAVLVFGVLQYVDRPSGRRALAVGCLSFVAILARPDNILCALGVPFLSWLLVQRGARRSDLVALSVLPVALVAAELIVCKAYFQVPLPLSFYMKSLNSYAGFVNSDNAVRNGYDAGWCALPFLAIMMAASKRERWPLILALLIPAVAAACYLLTVRQIMGWSGRFYIPLLPFAVIAALVSFDDARMRTNRSMRRTLLSAAAVILLFLGLHPLMHVAERMYNARVVPAPFAVPALPIAAPEPLPEIDWAIGIRQMGTLAASLPSGAVIAASEVGYLGYAAPKATVVDLVGLNDTHIAIHGFSVDYLLQRSPDLIWFPQNDYTGLRALLFSDPRLFARYTVIAGAFNYGVAIRRDSPLKPDIERSLSSVWNELYPSRPLRDYIVTRGS